MLSGPFRGGAARTPRRMLMACWRVEHNSVSLARFNLSLANAITGPSSTPMKVEYILGHPPFSLVRLDAFPHRSCRKLVFFQCEG